MTSLNNSYVMCNENNNIQTKISTKWPFSRTHTRSLTKCVDK